MTHGEIRGSLVLLALMTIVVIIVYISRPSSSPPAYTPEDFKLQHNLTPTQRQIDSMRLTDDASRQIRSDSLRKAERKRLSGHDTTMRKVSKKRRSSGFDNKSAGQRNAPKPSPHDRSIKEG